VATCFSSSASRTSYSFNSIDFMRAWTTSSSSFAVAGSMVALVMAAAILSIAAVQLAAVRRARQALEGLALCRRVGCAAERALEEDTGSGQFALKRLHRHLAEHALDHVRRDCFFSGSSQFANPTPPWPARAARVAGCEPTVRFARRRVRGWCVHACSSLAEADLVVCAWSDSARGS
jgi:hypothetical protein